MKNMQHLGEIILKLFQANKSEKIEKKSSFFQVHPIIYKFMTLLNFEGLWQKIFSYAHQNPVDFAKYFECHQIKKLKLLDLNLYDVKTRVIEFEKKYKKRNKHSQKAWMENQFRIFIWTVFHYAHYLNKLPLQFDIEDWQSMSSLFSKPPIICNYFYLCSRKGKSQPWTKEDDEFLLEVMKNPQYDSKWTDIGMLLFVKSRRETFQTPKSIRERWLNHLNPKIIKEQWEEGEDLRICEMVLSIGKKWSKISKQMKNRSEHAVKNRYNSLVQKIVKKPRGEYSITEEQKGIEKYRSILQSSVSNEISPSQVKNSDQNGCLQIKSANSYQNWFNPNFNNLNFYFMYQPFLMGGASFQ